MKNESLFDIYPWYRQHEHAVDMIAACLAVEVEEVLKDLDGKINPLEQCVAIKDSEAA